MSSVASLLSGTPAGLAEYAKVGTSTIAIGQVLGATINDTNVKLASTVIVCWGIGAADATAKAFSANILADGQFQIGCNAATTAAKTVAYAIVRY